MTMIAMIAKRSPRKTMAIIVLCLCIRLLTIHDRHDRQGHESSHMRQSSSELHTCACRSHFRENGDLAIMAVRKGILRKTLAISVAIMSVAI